MNRNCGLHDVLMTDVEAGAAILERYGAAKLGRIRLSPAQVAANP